MEKYVGITEKIKPLKIKGFTTIASVKNIIFKPNGIGNIFPIIQLYQNRELRKINVNAIVLDNMSEYVNLKIVKSSKLKITFSDDIVPKIEEVMNDKTFYQLAPCVCPTCSNRLVHLGNQELNCDNRFCSSSNRGFIYKLMDCALKDSVYVEDVTEFLNNYPVGDIGCKIDSIDEFKYVFESVKSKNSAMREDKWKKLFTEKHELMHSIELKLEKFLSSDEMSSVVFWETCNFPFKDSKQENELELLYDLNPRRYLEGLEPDIYNNLPKHIRDKLLNNHDFITWLLNFFDSFGKKEWFVSYEISTRIK